MSKAEPVEVIEERPQQEEEEGNAGECSEEKAQSAEGTPADPESTPGPDNEPKEKEDCDANADGTTQVKMLSIFTQVRNQIKSQVALDFHKKGILDVVNRVTRERARENGEQKPSQTKGKGEGETEAEDEEKREEEGENQAEMAAEEILEGALLALKGELLASIETLRNDFKEEMALLRADAHEYTDKAIKDLEAKALSPGLDPQKSKLQSMKARQQLQLQPGVKTQDRHKSLSVPSLVPPRPRVLNRTMTYLNPKACHSVVLGTRSKSEAIDSPGENKGGVRLLERSDFRVFATQGHKCGKAGGNLPPACPPQHNNKKVVRCKVRMGNSTTK